MFVKIGFKKKKLIILLKYIYMAILAFYIVEGLSHQPPPVSSLHLDNTTLAKVNQNTHQIFWRGKRVVKPCSCRYDFEVRINKGQWANLARMPVSSILLELEFFYDRNVRTSV